MRRLLQLISDQLISDQLPHVYSLAFLSDVTVPSEITDAGSAEVPLIEPFIDLRIVFWLY